MRGYLRRIERALEGGFLSWVVEARKRIYLPYRYAVSLGWESAGR